MTEDLSIYDGMGPAPVAACPHTAHYVEQILGKQYAICSRCGFMLYESVWWPVIEMDAIPDELASDVLRMMAGGRYLLRVRNMLYEVE